MKERLMVLVGVGSSGLGIALAQRFGREGFSVVLLGKDIQKLQASVIDLKEQSIPAYCFPIDLTKSVDIKNTFKKVKELGNIEVLIYNAVARRIEKPSALSGEHAVEDFLVNVAGGIDCVSQVINDPEHKQPETILFTGGGVALEPSIDASSMSLCKAALRNYVFSLGQELAQKNIYVGIVTILKRMEKGTANSPEKIADLYFEMYQKKEKREVII